MKVYLNSCQKYEATTYQDGEEAHWKNNPDSYQIKTKIVDSNTEMNLVLANGGGAAISFTPVY